MSDPPPDEVLTGDALRPGVEVDHFRVVRLLGRGGMAEVYLARDGLLGRKVALKVVRPDALGTRDAVDRFLFEARATAQFSHPSIVTVYAVGEHGSRPYVALEYLEGQTLRERMDEARPAVREAIRIALPIAEALAEAHRHDILHRDLKPENILIPRDGRVRVVDFGLAKRISDGSAEPSPDLPPDGDAELAATIDSYESEGQGLRGTPLYMAPEQWTGGQCTGATDVWALGLVLYEMVAGRLPYDAASLMGLMAVVCDPDPAPALAKVADVREELSDLVARCLAKDAEARPSAVEVVSALGGMIHPGRRRVSEEESPFPGLLAFSERHADFFFGRDAEIDELLERFREQPVLPVVGPSGAGKSSFVQAGVIPRLREQGPLLVLRVRPGAEPQRALAAKLLRGESTVRDRTIPTFPPEPSRRSLDRVPSEDDLGRLAAELLESPGTLNLHLRRLAEQQGARVLLFADQLEELDTLTEDVEARRAFMRALCTAADDPTDPVRVIFTLRDDFLGSLAEGTEVREALSRVTVLRSPGPQALEEILVRPVEFAGYEYDDPGLIPEMVGAVGGEPACLPLLQFATRTLWDRRDRDGRRLKRSVYDAVGGVAGALASHADGVLEGLSASQVKDARGLLLQLVTPEGTRRALPRSQVLSGMGPEASEVLDRLVKARLVSVRRSRSDRDGEAVVELAHESLVRTWKRLSRWLEESRDEIAFLAEATQAAELWERRGRRDDELWTGDALHEAQRHLERWATQVPESVSSFLGAAIFREGQAEKRQRRRRLMWTALLVGATIVAGVVAFAFSRQSQRAEEAARRTEIRWAEGELEGARAALLRGDVLEARARLRGALEVVDSPLGRALWRRVSRDPLLWSRDMGGIVYGVTFSPDGRRLAASCQDRTVYLMDAETRETTLLRGQRDQVFDVAWSRDGGRLATGDWSGNVGLWDLEEGRLRLLQGHEDQVWTVAWSPDGTKLASGSYDHTVRIWDGRTGALLRTVDVSERPVSFVTFSPDGSVLATASHDGTVRLLDVDTGAERLSIRDDSAHIVAFDGTGERLATGGFGGRIAVRDTKTGREIRVLHTKSGGIEALEWAPEGDRIAATAPDGRFFVFDAEKGAVVSRYRTGEANLLDLGWGPQGRRIATSSQEGVHVVDVTVPTVAPVRGGHEGSLGGVDVDPSGTHVATAGVDGTVRIWDVETGALDQVLEGHGEPMGAVAWSPSGSHLAWAGDDGLVRVWNSATAQEEMVLSGHRLDVNALSFSPDGRRLASCGGDQSVRVWALPDRRQERLLVGHEGPVLGVDFSPDGQTVASAGQDGTLRTWSLDEGGEHHMYYGHDGPAWSVAWSPDGASFVSGGEDGTVRVWDVETGSERERFDRGYRVYGVTFGAEGDVVGAAGADGTAVTIELATKRVTTFVGHRAEVNDIAYGPDTGVAATVSDDGTARLWDVATSKQLWRSPALVPSMDKLLTHRGWLGMSPAAEGARGEDLPAWARAVEARALWAGESPAGGALCLHTEGGEVELWDLGSDRRVFAEVVDDLELVRATDSGCVALAGGRVQLLQRSGSARDFSARASKLAVDRRGVLVAAEGRIFAFDQDGELLATHRAPPGLTTFARAGDHLVVGFEDGSLEVYAAYDSAMRSLRTLQDTPSSPVERVVAAPPGTVAVGFASGAFGLWDIDTGAPLDVGRLHGSLVHLDYRDGQLRAATDLGHFRVLDLSAFDEPYCDLLREVWQRVPIAWERGAARLRQEPPADHRCSEPEG